MKRQTTSQQVDILISDADRFDRSIKFNDKIQSASRTYQPQTAGQAFGIFLLQLTGVATVLGAVAIGAENLTRFADNRRLVAVNI